MPTPLSGFDLLIPLIIAIAKQTGLDKRVNMLIAIAVYVVWTVISLVTGLRDVPHATFADIAANFPAAFSAALATGYVAYQTIWKNLLNEEAITHATSIIKGPTEDPVVLTDEHDDVPPAIVSQPPAAPAVPPAPPAAPADPAAPDPAAGDPLTPPDDGQNVIVDDPVDDGSPQG